jgi:hypothetical protein
MVGSIIESNDCEGTMNAVAADAEMGVAALVGVPQPEHPAGNDGYAGENPAAGQTGRDYPAVCCNNRIILSNWSRN